jgi:hypothetical protein
MFMMMMGRSIRRKSDKRLTPVVKSFASARIDGSDQNLTLISQYG